MNCPVCGKPVTTVTRELGKPTVFSPCGCSPGAHLTVAHMQAARAARINVTPVSDRWGVTKEDLCPKLRCDRLHTCYWGGNTTWWADDPARARTWRTPAEAVAAYHNATGVRSEERRGG